MKIILSVLLLALSTSAFAWKKADADKHFNLINQCKFDEYKKLKADVDNSEHNDPRQIQGLKINVDSRVNNALVSNAVFGEKKPNVNYDCLRKLHEYQK